MKKLLIFLTIAIFIVGMGIGGYFLGRKMNYFLSDEEILSRSLEQLKEINSFELNSNLILPENAGQYRFNLKQILAKEEQGPASDFLFEMKTEAPLGIDMGEGNALELELFALKNKEAKTYFKIGEFPLLALFGLGEIMGQWLYFDTDELSKLNELAANETVEGIMTYNTLSELAGESDDPMVEIENELTELKNIIVSYLFEKNLFLLDQKLENSQENDQEILNYSLKIDEQIFKEMFMKFLTLTNKDKTEEELENLFTEFAPTLTNAKIAIKKSSLELKDFNFDFTMEEDTVQVFLAFNNYNRVNINSIETPEALAISDWFEYLLAEFERQAVYQAREISANSIAHALEQQCTAFTELEEVEQAEIDALPEAEKEGKEIENRVLAIQGQGLALARNLEKTDYTKALALDDPIMTELEENWPACSSDSQEKCNFAFANPSDGSAFDFDMTYVDPCNYWLNFYSDTGLIGHVNQDEKIYPLFKMRTYEEYLNDEYPETELYDASYSFDFDMSGDLSGGSMSFSFGTGTDEEILANESDDDRRKADMQSVAMAMRLQCADSINPIILNADVFSESYVNLSSAENINYISFSAISDPSGSPDPCANDASANCDYAFADKDDNGELLPLDLNEEGKIIVDPCDFRINFYTDADGLSYLNEEGMFLANGEEMP